MTKASYLTKCGMIKQTELTQYLYKRRLELGINKREAATLIEMSPSGYHQIEAGLSLGKPSQIQGIERAFGIDEGKLIWLHVCAYLERNEIDIEPVRIAASA